MKRLFVLCIMLVLGNSVFAQEDIELKGTVKNSKGEAVAGATVTLVSKPDMKDTTDASGAFVLTNRTAIQHGSVGSISAQAFVKSIQTKGNNLRFHLSSSAQNGTISLFSANGRRLKTISLDKMAAGVHNYTLPELAPGFYAMDLAVNQSVMTFKLIVTSCGYFLHAHNSGAEGTPVISTSIAAAQSTDTLLVEKQGYKTVNKPITSYTLASIAIVTDSIIAEKGNIFASVLGKTEEEIDAKLDEAFQQLFHGSGDQPIYYDGAIRDIANNDVRSEGQSYGLMICVQYDKREEFDKILGWTRRVMGFPTFGWQASFSGGLMSSGSAPDGEEYIAAALILGGRRWNDKGLIDQGKQVCGAMKGYFNGNLCRFVPQSGEIDVSYVLPAFYEVFAEEDTPNSGFWKNCANTGRAFFPKVCHSETMLTPKCAQTNGSRNNLGVCGSTDYASDFESDSWRVVANIMMDWLHFGVDKWQKETYAPKYAAFWREVQPKVPMPAKMSLDGKQVHDANDPRAKGLIAYNALLGYALPPEDAEFFVKELWDMKIPSGNYRYYDGCIYLMALAHASGKFKLKDW